MSEINIIHNSKMDLNKLSKDELLEKCEELKISKCKSKNKNELIDLINNKTTKKQIDLVIEEEDEERRKRYGNTGTGTGRSRTKM